MTNGLLKTESNREWNQRDVIGQQVVGKGDGKDAGSLIRMRISFNGRNIPSIGSKPERQKETEERRKGGRFDYKMI